MNKNLRSDLFLLLAAAIWGFAFVAQKIGMIYVGPFTYNGVRFALGALVLLPFLYLEIQKEKKNPEKKLFNYAGGLIAGILLFAGVSSQQIGLQWTTAGNAGFITGLYVVFVPIFGIFAGHKTNIFLWVGVLFASIGLYFLSVTSEFTINKGDAVVFICAIMWTFHVLVIAKYSPKMNVIKLAINQYIVCSVLCLICALIFENISVTEIYKAGIPIAYGGILSVGIAYTIQVYIQKSAHPVAASVILSLESFFAVLGGLVILSEPISLRGIIGCILMFIGMIFAQIKPSKNINI